jgi:hypothetical protein
MKAEINQIENIEKQDAQMTIACPVDQTVNQLNKVPMESKNMQFEDKAMSQAQIKENGLDEL